MSPCTDWIDNAGLNIALRQEAGEEDIFRSVYSAMTRTLPPLNDQVEVRKGWLVGEGGGVGRTLNSATLSMRDYCTLWDCKKKHLSG